MTNPETGLMDAERWKLYGTEIGTEVVAGPEVGFDVTVEVVEAAPAEAEIERLRAALSDFVARIEADEVHDPTDGAVCDICQWLYDAHEILGNTLSAGGDSE